MTGMFSLYCSKIGSRPTCCPLSNPTRKLKHLIQRVFLVHLPRSRNNLDLGIQQRKKKQSEKPLNLPLPILSSTKVLINVPRDCVLLA